MAAIASPIPNSFSAGGGEIRRPSARTNARSIYSRPTSNRSPLSLSTNHPAPDRLVQGDSSDDEDLAPIKLSAEAQAILGEDNSQAGSDKENIELRRSYNPYERSAQHEKYTPVDKLRSALTPSQEKGSPVPRVVRVTPGLRQNIPPTIARDGSFMYKIHDKSARKTEHSFRDSETPAASTRRVRVSGSRRVSKSPPSHKASKPSSPSAEFPRGESEHQTVSPEQIILENSPEDDFPAGPSTVTRPRKNEENGVQSTMRIRRIGVGSMLGKPMRRGMIRRPSEEDDHPDQLERESSRSPEIQIGRRAQESDLRDEPDLLPISSGSPQMPSRKLKGLQDLAELSALPNENKQEHRRSPPHVSTISDSSQNVRPTPASHGSHASGKSTSSQRKYVYQMPSLPQMEASHEQENEPPPTFKRAKPSAPVLEIHEDQVNDEGKGAALSISPERKPLVPKSNNTPHRPAPPPPPKMSLIEAATSNAGSRNKKSVHVVLNGRTYRRLDCIGRGGSSRVYRVMAENYKIFALKRVNLEDADMAAIAGYKGEIDLLRKLENVERVIRLFDYEINEEKGVLNVMMELGESDFNRMLNEQIKTENAKLDITFTRHYWKEMLECVQAVHDHDIVHSDLKPANFLLVKGQLKLIDFGIANAIQDNTVNVHRENQIGTPNYMSPESLVCHTPAIGAPPGAKILKLGKPSDVWSLGCILYQMTYGQPPFAHITKQFERIMSIPNPKVEIQFPTNGVGGSVVPFGLIKTLRRCLTREQSLRPTIKELLSDSDPFLNPVAISPDMLGRVIGNVVSYCRRREEVMRAKGELVGESSCLPKDEEMKGWPWAFYEKLKQAQEDGTAW